MVNAPTAYRWTGSRESKPRRGGWDDVDGGEGDEGGVEEEEELLEISCDVDGRDSFVDEGNTGAE